MIHLLLCQRIKFKVERIFRLSEFLKDIATRFQKILVIQIQGQIEWQSFTIKLCIMKYFNKRTNIEMNLLFFGYAANLWHLRHIRKGQMCMIINSRMHFRQKRFSCFLWYCFYAIRVDREMLDKILLLQCFTFNVLFIYYWPPNICST